MLTPTDYIKRRCAEARIPYETLMSSAKPQPVAALRQKLCVELHQRFKLSSARIGWLLGGKDHSTVVYAWRKAGYSVGGPTRRKLTPAQVERMHALHEDGMAIADIARAVGASRANTARILDPATRRRQDASKKKLETARATAFAARRHECWLASRG